MKVYLRWYKKHGKFRKPKLSFSTMNIVEDKYPYNRISLLYEFIIGWIILYIEIY